MYAHHTTIFTRQQNVTSLDQDPHLASMYFSGYDEARSAGFLTRRPPGVPVEGNESPSLPDDGLAHGTNMNFDEMCNPSSLVNESPHPTDVNHHNIFYFQFENWKRPSWLYPVWVCSDSEVVCWPKIDPENHAEKFDVEGMKDDDHNGVVDDGLCRWHANDIIRECKKSTKYTDTVANETEPTECLRPTPEKLKSKGCTDAVLRWNVLPMYPLDRATRDPETASKKVSCTACVDLDADEKSDRYCCEQRDVFSDSKLYRSEVKTTHNVKISTHLLDTLTDFGPVDRSRSGGPKRDGLKDDNGNYIFNIRTPGTAGGFPTDGYYSFEPNEDQNRLLHKAYQQFVQGPCAHPCTYINDTGLVCPTRSCVTDDPTTGQVACKQYTSNTLAACYCEGQLSNASAVDKRWLMFKMVLTSDPVCRLYATNSILRTLTAPLATALVVVVNFVLVLIFKQLAMVERPWHWFAG